MRFGSLSFLMYLFMILCYTHVFPYNSYIVVDALFLYVLPILVWGCSQCCSTEASSVHTFTYHMTRSNYTLCANALHKQAAKYIKKRDRGMAHRQ